ncbi:MAG: hypothetical protein KDC49_07840 [Saprospiraceae bacterium]|nr:hypothetical protein [Saprospiraceae bacterium]
MKNKLSLLSFCLFLVACLPDETGIDMGLIEKKLYEEGENYKRLRLFNCRQSLMIDVEKMVDSIMINNINFSVGEGILFPGRPYKPNYVGYIQLNDTLKARPFLTVPEDSTDAPTKNEVDTDSIN